MDQEDALFQHIPDNNLRVLILVSRPALALRYRLPDGQIRKMQMKFEPASGWDVALETFKAAGLPIRVKDLPQLQGQHQQGQPSQSSQLQPRSQERPGSLNAVQIEPSQSSQSQPHTQEPLGPLNAGQIQRSRSFQSQSHFQERPGILNTRQATYSQTLQDALPGPSQLLPQKGDLVRNEGYGGIPPSAQPTKFSIRPTSAPSGVNHEDLSRPIPASSQSYLDSLCSTTTVSSAPALAKLRNRPILLPGPVFNGTYESIGSFQARPMSAPEQTQTQRDYANTVPLSQMLPPERTLPFPDKKTHPFRKDEIISQEEPSQKEHSPVKTKVNRQTKPRAQPAKPRKSRAKVGLATLSSNPLSLDSPSHKPRVEGKTPLSSAPPKARTKAKASASTAPPRAPSPGLKAIPPSSEPPALPSINPRKHSLTDQSVDQPNKRQVLAMTEILAEIMTETTPKTLPTAAAEQQPGEKPLQDTDPLINNSSHDLLNSIDNFMRKHHDHTTQSDEDREKAMIDMICKCNKDKTFEKLMIDLEGAWKMIGLGL